MTLRDALVAYLVGVFTFVAGAGTGVWIVYLVVRAVFPHTRRQPKHRRPSEATTEVFPKLQMKRIQWDKPPSRETTWTR